MKWSVGTEAQKQTKSDKKHHLFTGSQDYNKSNTISHLYDTLMISSLCFTECLKYGGWVIAPEPMLWRASDNYHRDDSERLEGYLNTETNRHNASEGSRGSCNTD